MQHTVYVNFTFFHYTFIPEELLENLPSFIKLYLYRDNSFWIRYLFVRQKAKRVTAFSSPEGKFFWLLTTLGIRIIPWHELTIFYAGEEKEKLDSTDISESIPLLACQAAQSGDQIIFFEPNRADLSKGHLKKSRWPSIVTAKVMCISTISFWISWILIAFLMKSTLFNKNAHLGFKIYANIGIFLWIYVGCNWIGWICFLHGNQNKGKSKGLF